ncbi:MAG TPA: hypothetical protein VEH55_05195 [Gaiellaceae bacterium]|nr:hypothetical protein [Gaiellaceae bacterium]
MTFPPELVEVIAQRAAQLVRESMTTVREQASPYLTGWAAAAEYTGLSESTLKHTPSVPRRKVGGAVVFRRGELDAWLDADYEGSRRYMHGSRTVPSRASGRPLDSVGAKKSPA